MNELFGLSMTYIAAGCVAATAVILLLVAFIAWRNPVMFKLGLRNIPRRKAQTALIIVGLMLSTLIITAAFGTGDTLTRSVTAEVYTILGPADEVIQWDTENHPAAEDQQVIPLATVEQWQKQFVDSGLVKALFPYLREQMSVVDARTRLNEADARITAARPQDIQAFGGLADIKGKPVNLGPGEIAVNEELADKIDALPGDQVSVIYKGQAVSLTVAAIVPNTLLGGANSTFNRAGAAVNYDFLSRLVQREGKADFVAVSNDGSVRGGLGKTTAVVNAVKQQLAGTPYKVIPAKEDNIHTAELVGNAFTTIFVVFGLFSIAAGILLIFLIFVMLAAERKPEMGMARAVGAKRRQIVESFLAEGMGYDLGSAVLGLVAGMGVTVLMVWIIKVFAGENLGLRLSVAFSLRSLVVSFCLGVITTFLVVFIASWRASRINITAAIRDLPETRPVNPEAATWKGYLRAVLNGVIALGIPLGAALMLLSTAGLALGSVLALVGLVSPWSYLLRGSDFALPRARRHGEPLPRWPWILGLALPVIGWLLILPWYWLAVLFVRVTRERKPARIPVWLQVAGIAVPPLGYVLVLLQDARARISWSAGLGAAFGLAGAAMIAGGLDRSSAFFYSTGVSLVFFWAALALRYFHIQERLTFTGTSVLLLVYWYLEAPNKLNWLHHKLDGGIEMFFISGMVMVTCGVFIIVYNADIVLPAVGRLGSRFGRILPAIRTGVAYPLQARFRTGMTMSMIGLIMFALVMNATINKNFSELFLNDDTRGGFDVLVQVNSNNRVDDITAALRAAGANSPDLSKVRGAGELRIAYPFEAEVQNKDNKRFDKQICEPADPTKCETRNVAPPFLRYTFFGADRGFLETTTLAMKFRAAGYDSDRAVWEAIARDPTLAVIDAQVTAEPNPFGPPTEVDLLQLDPVRDGFQPFTLQLRDPGTQKTTTITVIGQIKNSGDVFLALGGEGAPGGIVTGKENLLKAFPDSKAQRYYLALQPGTDAKAYAKRVEASLVQASADSLQKLLDDQQALQTGFLLVFQGFMGLGLIVGIAALGVVASRAVVERRQQIGMLRAIGYQRSMVALSFLFESGFIALSGILLGLALGLSLAWVLFTSGNFGEESQNVSFVVPWLEIGIVCAIAFTASMIMTWLPARGASHVPVAEALRYE